MTDFQVIFGRAAEGAARAPGRVNLIGEHTDYNDGFVLPIAIERQVTATWARRADRKVRFHSATLKETAEIDLDAELAPQPGAWSNYPAGVAAELLQAGVKLAGADVLLESDLPLGGGLSSSAALEVATALALMAATAGEKTRPVDGRELQHGVDWQLVASNQVQLIGEACAATSVGEHTVTADFPCECGEPPVDPNQFVH